MHHFHLCSISRSACPNQLVRVEKQLSERVNPAPGIPVSFLIGLLGVDLDSKLRLRSCLTADIKCTVGSGGGSEDLNFLQKFICLVMASSVLTSLSVLTISSFMTSAHSPHIHLPWYRSLMRSTYAGVHSSVNPQQSQMTNSTSIWAVPTSMADGWVSGAEITKGSLIMVADMVTNPVINVKKISRDTQHTTKFNQY